jgi:hypothetical protein
MVSDKKIFMEFPIGSYVKLSSAVEAILKQSLDGSLPKLCQVVRPFDQDGPHSRT